MQSSAAKCSVEAKIPPVGSIFKLPTAFKPLKIAATRLSIRIMNRAAQELSKTQLVVLNSRLEGKNH
eukprot:scaffold3759_cov124-Skeletonema_dohrnii-CCMP3373.AAC.10